MAENWCTAFGRYLKTLRERRGLSLQGVCSLSQAFTETLNKGYLSRCENGRQGLAFSKVIPLGRIYGVPADVLLERLELDMELDRVGGPDTGGRSFSDLTEAGIDALQHGFGWQAYAVFRDAIPFASSNEVMPRYSSQEEQSMCAFMNCATAARVIGRKRFALHEYKFVEESGDLGPKYRPIILERLSVCYRTLNQRGLALSYGNEAIIEAERLGDSNRLGYAYSNRAQLEYSSSELESSIRSHKKAYDAFKAANLPVECVRTLNNLAQAYFDLGRLRAARRMLVAADKIATSQDQHRARALGRILMGEIDHREHKVELAVKRWKEAAEIAKKLDDKILRFKAEFFLFKQAHESGDDPVARSLHRRLRKLSHWIPKDTPELLTYRQLVRDRGQASQN